MPGDGPRGRRPGGGDDPGYPGLIGPLTLPLSRPERLALLLRAAGVTVLPPEDCPALAEVEAATAEAQPITMGINAWEWRWPLGSFVARNASVLSPSARERHARSQAMTQAEYAALLVRREQARAAYAALDSSTRSSASLRQGPRRSAWRAQATRSLSCPAPCSGPQV